MKDLYLNAGCAMCHTVAEDPMIEMEPDTQNMMEQIIL